MKFAIDVDGVITDAPVFFKIVIESLLSSGHEVHILTDFDEHFRKQREKELKALGISYTKLEITGDKSGYCERNNIDFVIDDNINDYFQKFSSVPVGILEITNK